MTLDRPAARFRLRGGGVARTIATGCAVWLVVVTPILMAADTRAILASPLALVGLLIAAIVAITRRGEALGVVREPTAQSIAIEEGRIVAGIHEALWGVHQVTFELEGGEAIAVRARDRDDAEHLLDAARVNLRQRSLSLHLGTTRTALARFALATMLVLSSFFAVPATLLTLLLLNSRHVDVALSVVLFTGVDWALLAWSARALRRCRVTIGRDGVRVSRTLSSDFISFAGMDVLVLGREVRLRAGGRRHSIHTSSPDEARSVGRRIEDARAAFDERRAAQLDLLARQGRDLEHWRAALAELVVEDYRAPIDRQELVMVVEDPSAPREQRVGAALAISSLPADAPERVRLRVAIETTADPALRHDLEAAAGSLRR